MKNYYIALENVRSLYNIGALFRTCSFFGIKKVLLVGYSGKNFLPNGKVVLHDEIKKSSLGSENDLEIIFLDTSEDLVQFASTHKLNLFAIEQHKNSEKLQHWVPESNSILVFGNEVSGVSSEVLNQSHKIIEIERIGQHNSLNITTSCGIVLYHITQEH